MSVARLMRLEALRDRYLRSAATSTDLATIAKFSRKAERVDQAAAPLRAQLERVAFAQLDEANRAMSSAKPPRSQPPERVDPPHVHAGSARAARHRGQGGLPMTKPVSKRTRYVQCTAKDIPDGVHFDIPSYHQGQIIEVAYGCVGRSAGAEGDPYKRIRDLSDASTTYYRLLPAAKAEPLSSRLQLLIDNRSGDEINDALSFFDTPALRPHFTALIAELREARDAAWDREALRGDR